MTFSLERLSTDFTWGDWTRIQLCLYGLLYTYYLFYPCGQYGRLNGVTDRFNHAVSITGGPFWTDLWHNQIDRSSLRNRQNEKCLK